MCITNFKHVICAPPHFASSKQQKQGIKYTNIQKCNCTISRIKILSTALHSPMSVPHKKYNNFKERKSQYFSQKFPVTK